MASSDYIGLDVGKSRVGFARGTDQAKIAEPLFSLPTGQAVARLDELKPLAVVAGLPRSLEGKDTEQTKWVRQWVDKAKSHTGFTFYAQDEALTTVEAEKRLSKNTGKDIDALAAAVILQDFLDSKDAERVVF